MTHSRDLFMEGIRMRSILASGIFGLALAFPFFLGCKHAPIVGDRYTPPAAPGDPKVDAASLVKYLNDNARMVQSVRAKVDIDAKQGRQAIGLGGHLACQKPRFFRIKASVVGRPAVDLGSNSEEFWYWIGQEKPPYVYHCSYRDLSTGKVRVPLPFHPDMVIAALGIAEYDPAGKYELKEQSKRLELIQQTATPDGQPARRITVFNRFKVAPGQPQVQAHILTDMKGKLICQAVVERVQEDRTTKAMLPTRVTIQWPAQELSMTLMLTSLETNAVEGTLAGRLFSRTDLAGFDSFDLARGGVDSPGGLRSAGGTALPRR